MKPMGELVRLLDIDEEFIIELRYATENNFTKEKIYKSGECYIHKNTANSSYKSQKYFFERCI